MEQVPLLTIYIWFCFIAHMLFQFLVTKTVSKCAPAAHFLIHNLLEVIPVHFGASAFIGIYYQIF